MSWIASGRRARAVVGACMGRRCIADRPSWATRCARMLCVGVAYFLIAVLVPAAALTQQGEWRNFTLTGTATATIAGALGALGAVCITYAFRNGGSPTIVMPLVFGGAPLINVISTMIMHPPKSAPNPMLYVGFLLAAAGAGMVLYFRPRA